MAGIIIEPLVISTYARFILSQRSAVAESITLLSLPVEKLMAISSGETSLTVEGALSREAITIALASPAKPFIFNAMHALSRVLQTRLEIQLTEDEIFVREPSQVNPQKIDESLLKKATVVECNSLLQKIDVQMGDNFDDYQNLLHTSAEGIASLINSEMTQLNEHETNELLFQESMEDLKGRMLDLSLDWPKLNYNDFGITDYLALKAYIAIYNAYARQQQTLDKKMMQKHFKQILKES